jgi:hypothetical protein
VVLDLHANIFGDVTPVEWESPKWNGKEDDDNKRIKGDDSLRRYSFYDILENLKHINSQMESGVDSPEASSFISWTESGEQLAK